MSRPSTAAPAHAEPPRLLSDSAVLERLAVDLAQRFAGTFCFETVDRYVFESYVALRSPAKVKSHLVPLTAHFAADRLTALAQAQGAIVSDVTEVLFVCVHNAARS